MAARRPDDDPAGDDTEAGTTEGGSKPRRRVRWREQASLDDEDVLPPLPLLGRDRIKFRGRADTV